LWLRYGGREVQRIEAEMRARGWPFYRQVLCAKSRRGCVVEGWPERFGAVDELTPEERERRARDLLLRRNRFDYWLADNFPEMTWNMPFQRHIFSALARVTSGKCKRLMIFLPPRHGKSEMITVRYSVWRLLRDARLNIILAGYNQKLANRFSRKIKRIASGEGH
jgi:hypothetical protein